MLIFFLHYDNSHALYWLFLILGVAGVVKQDKANSYIGIPNLVDHKLPAVFHCLSVGLL